jgi:hypothetical protein
MQEAGQPGKHNLRQGKHFSGNAIKRREENKIPMYFGIDALLCSFISKESSLIGFGLDQMRQEKSFVAYGKPLFNKQNPFSFLENPLPVSNQVKSNNNNPLSHRQIGHPR